MRRSNYSREEEERLLASLRKGLPPECPRCGARLSDQRVPPRGELPYVRDRVWLVCSACRRSVVIDRRRVEENP
jgi:hypothetical protein